jgi:peptidylprolyl isomerase
MLRSRAAAFLLLLTVLAGACGGDDDTLAGGEAATAAGDEAETGVTEAAPAQASPAAVEKPEVVVPEGAAPTELVIEDLVEGTGAEATTGSYASVNYVGVLFKDGTEFDNSYDRGAPFNVTLGAGRVIKGWDEGLVGMKVGGRRQLVIPPDLAYGEGGSGSIGPNETLVFVIDLVALTEPATAADAELPAEAPTEITVTDLVEGDGAAIAADQVGTFQYIVVDLAGTELDNSWLSGAALTFAPGDGTVPSAIADQLVGMKVGGRRQLALPAGTEGLTAEQDLVFIFDLTALA